MADDGKNPNDELSTNLFSDIAPILALFGEPFARQFMSESMGWLDHLIFALAPLGILTAVVSAIRVGGPEWLRAIVGRARENVTTVELELMSSTSDEVCELWNGTGVVRTVGNPEVKEIIYLDHLKNEDSCGLYTVEAALAMIQAREQEKRKALVTSSDESLEGEKQMGVKIDGIQAGPEFRYSEREDPLLKSLEKLQFWKKKETDLEIMAKANELMDNHGGAPNISLNLHGGTKAWEQWAGMVFGLVIQLGVLVFSGITVYHPRFNTRLTIEGNMVASFAFPLMVTGTLMMAVGLTLCCAVVDRGSQEAELSLEKDGRSGETRFARMLWLQRKHAVADQQFNTYAIFGRNKEEHEMLSRVALSRRSKPLTTRSPSFVKRHPALQVLFTNRHQVDTTIGSLLSLIGFMLQLIALRQLHWSTSISHLGALVLMSLVRAWLRRGLIVRPHAVPIPHEHELDWLSLQMASDGLEGTEDDEESTTKLDKPTTEGQEKECRSCDWWPSEGDPDIEDGSEGRNVRTHLWIDSGLVNNHTQPTPIGPINHAIKIRQRLGSLTKWTGPMSNISVILAKSISAVMDGLTDPRTLATGTVFHWKIRACMSSHDLGKPSQAKVLKEDIRMTACKSETGWETDATRIEAVLSVWLHHIIDRAIAGETIAGKLGVSKDWLQHSTQTKVKAVRLVAPKTVQSSMDIERWASGPGLCLESMKASQLSGNTSIKNGTTGEFLVGMSPLPLNGKSYTIDSKAQLQTNKSQEDEYLVFTSEAEYNLLVLLAQHIFTAFLVDFAVGIEPGQLANSATARNADQVSVKEPESFSALRLECGMVEKICERVEYIGLANRYEARASIVSALNLHSKLPFKPVMDVVRNLVWKDEIAATWSTTIPAYRRLFKGKYGHCNPMSEDFRSLIVIAVDLLDKFNKYIKDAPNLTFHREDDATGTGFPLCETYMPAWKKKLARAILEMTSRIPYFNLHLLREWFQFQHRGGYYDAVFDILLAESKRLGKYGEQFAHQAPSGFIQDSRVNLLNPTHWTPLHYVAVNREKLSIHGRDPALGDLAYSTAAGRREARKCYRNYADAVLRVEGRRNINNRDLFGMTPLHCSLALRPSEEAYDFLMDNGAGFNLRDRRGRSALHYLAARNFSTFSNRDHLFEAIATQVECENLGDFLGYTALLTACYEGAHEAVRTLVGREVDVAERSITNGWSGLHLALRKADNLEVVQILVLEGGADTEIGTSDENIRALHICAALGRTRVARFLIEKGADVNTVDSRGRTPLHYCTDPEIMKLLIDKGANVNAEDLEGETPLYWAQYYFTHNLENIKLLIEAGAIIETSTLQERGLESPLHALARLRVTNDVNLLESDPSLGGPMRNLRSGLFTPGDESRFTEVPYDVNVEEMITQYHCRPRISLGVSTGCNLAFEKVAEGLHDVSQGTQNLRKAEIARMLIKAGAKLDPGSKSSERWEPLHYAAENHDVSLIRVLVDSGASIEEVLHLFNSDDVGCKYRMAPLAIAVASGASISTRVGPQHRQEYSYAQKIYETCQQNSFEAVQLLLDLGANPNGELGSLPPLHAAIFHAKAGCISEELVRLMELLLSRGADVNLPIRHPSPSQHGMEVTPLHLAVQTDNFELARFLINAGACINFRSTTTTNGNPDKHVEGYTPLHLAVLMPFIQRQVYPVNKIGAEWVAREVWRFERFGRSDRSEPNGLVPVKDRDFNVNTLSLVELLLDSGADVEAKTSEGQTVLQIAVSKASVSPTLNSIGSEYRNPINDGNSAVSLPTDFDYPQLIRLLVARGASLDARTPNGGTVLHTVVSNSVYSGNSHLPQSSIQAELGRLDRITGETMSSLLCNPKIVELDATDEHGRTALYYSRLNELRACEQVLLASGASDGPESQPSASLLQSTSADLVPTTIANNTTPTPDDLVEPLPPATPQLQASQSSTTPHSPYAYPQSDQPVQNFPNSGPFS